MSESFDREFNKYLTLIEKYKFNGKMVEITTKIRKMQSAIASKHILYIKKLTKHIREKTDFEGIPYIEKETHNPEVIRTFQNAYYLMDRLSLLAFKKICEHEFGKKIDELGTETSVVYKTIKLLEGTK